MTESKHVDGKGPSAEGEPSQSKVLIIEVHGACRDPGKPIGISAFGIHFCDHDDSNVARVLETDFKPNNERAALSGAVSALETAFVMKYNGDTFHSILIKTDSSNFASVTQHSIDWWRRKGWRGSRTYRPMKDNDLWEHLYKLKQLLKRAATITIDFEYVEPNAEGLSGRARVLANEALDSHRHKGLKTFTNAWVIDTEGTHHQCNDRSQFSRWSYKRTWPVPVNDGAGGTLWGLGIGRVVLNVRLSDGRSRMHVLENVLHVPGRFFNVVALTAISNWGVLQVDNGPTVNTASGNEMFWIPRVHPLLVVQLPKGPCGIYPLGTSESQWNAPAVLPVMLEEKPSMVFNGDNNLDE